MLDTNFGDSEIRSISFHDRTVSLSEVNFMALSTTSNG
jgi:hypothetical protein